VIEQQSRSFPIACVPAVTESASEGPNLLLLGERAHFSRGGKSLPSMLLIPQVDGRFGMERVKRAIEVLLALWIINIFARGIRTRRPSQ
jgi:hypothetical protein